MLLIKYNIGVVNAKTWFKIFIWRNSPSKILPDIFTLTSFSLCEQDMFEFSLNIPLHISWLLKLVETRNMQTIHDLILTVCSPFSNFIDMTCKFLINVKLNSVIFVKETLFCFSLWCLHVWYITSKIITRK
jgi:hypothetical protein